MADDTARRLVDFLTALNDKPIEWGVDDCSAMCAMWARENGYPVKPPAYASQDEAHRLIETAGGLVALWDELASDAGINERIGAPEIGDVGIIDTRLYGHVGVIWGEHGICCWRTLNSAAWITPRGYIKAWAIT